jgi:DNA-binding LacI/PurR family transcriptional regulator
VSEETRRRVLEAAQQLAYEPSHAARALAGRKTQTLGAILPEIASGFYADVLAGIDEVAAENGFDVLASFVGKRRSRAEMIKRLLRQGRVDALLLVNLEDTADLTAQSVEGLPIILIDRGINGSKLPVVGMDNVGGAEATIEHLFAQGHHRIAILTGPSDNYDSEQRLMGCRQAMAKLGLKLDPAMVWTGGFTLASGTAAARQFLQSGLSWPDAIFCLNDAMAIGVFSEFRQAGFSVPGDVALAGFDDVDAAAHLSLTSVACPMRLMGQLAARWAVDLVTKNQRPTAHQLAVRLVVRNSSAGKLSGQIPMSAASEPIDGKAVSPRKQQRTRGRSLAAKNERG